MLNESRRIVVQRAVLWASILNLDTLCPQDSSLTQPSGQLTEVPIVGHLEVHYYHNPLFPAKEHTTNNHASPTTSHATCTASSSTPNVMEACFFRIFMAIVRAKEEGSSTDNKGT
jgi:hypothetical protein